MPGPTVAGTQSAQRNASDDPLEFALEMTLADHASWEVRFRSAIGGSRKLGAARVRGGADCALEQWLAGQPEGDAAVEACRRAHRKFYAEANFVAERINSGDFDTARRALERGGRYRRTASELERAVAQLRDIGDGEAPRR